MTRVNCSGYGLYLLSLRKRRMFEPSSIYPWKAGAAVVLGPEGGANPSYVSSANSNAFRWNIPTASGNIAYSFYVPIAMDRLTDPRGAMLMTIPSGNATLTLTLNTALIATSGVDTVYTDAAATCVLNSPTTSAITCQFEYWDPIPVPGVPAPNGIPLPVGDLSLIHEVKSITDASGMAASATKQVVLPSGRDYYTVIGSTVENGALKTSDLQSVQWVFDGQTVLTNENLAAHLARLQMELGRDLPEGVAPYYDFSDRPFDANSFGSLSYQLLTQSGFTSSGTTYHETITEALYSTAMAAA